MDYPKHITDFISATTSSKALTRERELVSQPKLFFSNCLQIIIGAEIHALLTVLQCFTAGCDFSYFLKMSLYVT